MAEQLVALRLPPTRVDEWLRRAWEDGDAVLPLDPSAPAAAEARVLERLRPARRVSLDADGAERVEALDDGEPVAPDTALVVATSGSTGAPKGVVLSHAAVAASTTASVARLGCRPGEAWLCCLPTHHVAGLQTLLRSRAVGAEPVVHDRFDVAAAAAVADAGGPDGGPVHVSLVPTQLARLLDAGVEVARFATILLGGGPAPPGLLDRAREAGARVVTSYGMSETCGGCVYDGRPLDGVEVGLGDDGRIRVRGAVRFAGYRRDPAATADALDPDGWFTTGDVGAWRDGRLEVHGRADDVVVSGGENVPLAAVVAALRSHPGVADAAALGVDDADWGRAVVAAVVPADPDAPPSPAELRRHVRADHPPVYAPREIRLVAALPRDGMGKVPRGVLADLLAVE